MLRAILPKPPSVNHLYGFTSRGGFARSYITKQGKQWFSDAGYLLKSQVKIAEPIQTEVAVTFWLYTCRFQDASNLEKALFDLLEEVQIIKNDVQIIEHHSYTKKVAHRKDEKVVIALIPLLK